jgi:hypothetical protein
MGFYDSFKTGVSGFLAGAGDFLSDTLGMAFGAAPTIIPLLQSVGVIPQIQPSYRQPQYPQYPTAGYPTGRPAPTYLPGGAPSPQYPIPASPSPVGFAPGAPSPFSSYAPAGVSPMPAYPSTRGGFAQAGFNLQQTPNGGGVMDLPFIDIVGQGGGNKLARLTSPFVPTMAGARPQPFVASNPVTGRLTWFKPAGHPILWSGDLSACKRVGKIASRARRAKR